VPERRVHRFPHEKHGRRYADDGLQSSAAPALSDCLSMEIDPLFHRALPALYLKA